MGTHTEEIEVSRVTCVAQIRGQEMSLNLVRAQEYWKWRPLLLLLSERPSHWDNLDILRDLHQSPVIRQTGIWTRSHCQR